MEPGEYYHIYNRSNNRELLFKEHENYLFFLRKFGDYLKMHVDTYAYCLMPNHFHFLIRINELTNQDDLILAFKNFFISYVKSINEKYSRTGSLFQAKFKKKQVEEEHYLTGLIHYIHSNPIKAGLCKNFVDWPYSSYSSLISEKFTHLKREEVLDWFNGKEDFVTFHQQNIDYSTIKDYAFD